MLGYLILFLDTQLTVCSIAAGKKTNSSSVYLFNSVTEFMRLLYFRKPLEQEFIECYLKDFENLYDALDEPEELQICQFLKSVADSFNLLEDVAYYHQNKVEGGDNKYKFEKSDTDDFFQLLADRLRTYSSSMKVHDYVATNKGIFEGFS